jgi:nucleotide-binding universal stress UspA family protein
MNPRHILIPVDFSENTPSAISTALALANSSTKITLLHVLQVLYPPHLQPIFAYERELKAFEAESEKHLRELAGSIAPKADVEIAIEGGVPWERVADFAGEHGVDLIVMPTHGRSGLKHLWLGSVAERVVQHAPCNVLVVRANNTRRDPVLRNAGSRCCHSVASERGSQTPCACASEKKGGDASSKEHLTAMR